MFILCYRLVTSYYLSAFMKSSFGRYKNVSFACFDYLVVVG